MNASNGIDSEDDDIFEVLRIKPVAKLTKQQAIEIKNRVLDMEEKNSRNERKSNTPATKGCKRKFGEGEDQISSSNTARRETAKTVKKVTPVKVGSSPHSCKSSPKQITDYFSPVKSPNKDSGPVVDDEKLSSNLVGGNKQIKVELNLEVEFESPSLPKCEMGSDNKADVKNKDVYSELDGINSVSPKKHSKTRREFSYFYSQSLKRIIHHVLKNELLLEEQTVKKGKIFCKLFMKEEYECFERFFKLDEKACSLFARMLCRKKSWHRVKGDSKRKEDCIDAFVRNSREQRSVMDMWKKNSEKGNVELLKRKIKEMLGTCIRLNRAVQGTFNKLLLLFSLPHDVSEEDNWGSQIRMFKMTLFHTKIPFVFMAQLDIALTKKNFKDFFAIGQKAKKKFQKAIENVGFKERFQELPSFLRRYNAGSVYARILTIYCEKFRSKKSPEEILQILNMLLDQDVFLLGKRGCWCNALVQTYEEMGKTVEAASALLKGLKEYNVSEVDRLTLQLRGRSILNKKKNGIVDIDLRRELTEACWVNITDPLIVEVKAKSLFIKKPGVKTVYVHESVDGRIYSSVEEHVINSYKRNGFTKGIHTEGALIQTIYFLVFFDIIYGCSPPGVFQSPYQERPLDLFSQSFYLNRKEAIDTRLGGDEEVVYRGL
ncbi:UNVERIFIED_CONTAM: hypothetical protein PYX00_000578 [Menopon gallinae]|uniref:Fanconi-associated nuclease n=1 Tax=Menopon gallinae TaxID=328185 RepID=A0AAW2I9X0_9NEOP